MKRSIKIKFEAFRRSAVSASRVCGQVTDQQTAGRSQLPLHMEKTKQRLRIKKRCFDSIPGKPCVA